MLLPSASKMHYSYYIVSIVEVALCLYKSNIEPCMEYCYNGCTGVPNCSFNILDKIQKWVCKTVHPTLVASLKPLAHLQN